MVKLIIKETERGIVTLQVTGFSLHSGLEL